MNIYEIRMLMLSLLLKLYVVVDVVVVVVKSLQLNDEYYCC